MLKEFDKEDWEAFAGAEPFPCGGAPLISIGMPQNHITILGKDQVEVFSNDLETIYAYDVEFPTQEGAKLFYHGIVGIMCHPWNVVKNLESIGFKKIS